MKKIAVILQGQFNDRKGMFNAAHNRVLHLKNIANYEIDVYMISFYPWGGMRLFSKEERVNHVEICELDGVQYRIKWVADPLVDYISEVRLHRTRYIRNIQLKRLCRFFKDYDLIDAHSLNAGYVAQLIKSKYSIPYVVTWHGSDIHQSAFNSELNKKRIIRIIENADMNFFVSKNLLEVSNRITENGNKMVLYNGCDSRFKRLDERSLSLLKEQYGVSKKKVVSFCGTLIPIKNALVLPKVFEMVSRQVGDVQFWFVGDGKHRAELENQTKNLDVVFWGNQPPEKMPEFMNLTDVLVLPSKNEGLPLVAAEALNCGAHAVGSKVGGIPEVMGEVNTFDLNSPNFEKELAERILYFLTDGINAEQPVASHFDWKVTARIENDIINKMLK